MGYALRAPLLALNQRGQAVLAQLQIDATISAALAGFFHDVALPPIRFTHQQFECAPVHAAKAGSKSPIPAVRGQRLAPIGASRGKAVNFNELPDLGRWWPNYAGRVRPKLCEIAHGFMPVGMTPKSVHFWKPKWVWYGGVMYLLCLQPDGKVCAVP